MKEKYWDLEKLHMNDKQIEDFFKMLNNGEKIIISVHKHSCTKKKFPNLEIGETYWIDVSENIMSSRFAKCKITYKRGGIIFFIEEDETEEKHFAEFSLMHYFTSPLEITVDLDPDYYEIIDHSGKMRVNYTGKII